MYQVWPQSSSKTKRKNTFSIHHIIPEKYCQKSSMLNGTLGRIWDLFFSILGKLKAKRVIQNETFLQFFSFFVTMRFPVGQKFSSISANYTKFLALAVKTRCSSVARGLQVTFCECAVSFCVIMGQVICKKPNNHIKIYKYIKYIKIPLQLKLKNSSQHVFQAFSDMCRYLFTFPQCQY